MNKFYELWGKEIHREFAQLKSIERARKADTTPDSIDTKSMTGIFPGRSNPYIVTLSSCTCGSFISRRKPCKHMYRLAMECGLFAGEFNTGLNKNSLSVEQISFEDAVAELENLSDTCQILIMDRIRLKDGPFVTERLDDYSQFTSCSLVTEIIPTYEMVTASYTKNKILAICERHNIVAPSELKKRNLIEWCLENHPDIFFSMKFTRCFQKKQHIVYRYLKRKYDDDTIFDPYTGQEYSLPFSAEKDFDTGLYFFPDDEITEMLNRFGQNRCLYGFDLLAQNHE